MASICEFAPLRDGLKIIEKTHELGFITSGLLAQAQGWNRVRAWRYLEALAHLGWLERDETGRKYYLGPALRRLIDVRI